ncbi:MAG: hypothetical protein ACRECV_07300 [Xanthobacteraceae bacterium]
MSKTTVMPRAPEPRDFGSRGIAAHAIGAPVWMAAAFLVSAALAALVLAAFGAGERGTALALRVTARWCFLLFWAAYAGGALAKFFGSRFAILARHGRTFGLAFASALLVHVALVVWLYVIVADQRAPMLFFWAGVLCTYALALFSVARLRDALGSRLWRLAMELALQYIMLVFAADFIVEPLRASGPDKYPLSYVPFVIMVAGGIALRLAAQLRRPRAAAKA